MPFGVISEKEANDHAVNAAGYATPEQIDAIREWAAKYGRTWKARLREAWMDGDYDGFDKSWLLQRVRNNLGPSWLNRFVLAKASFYQMQSAAAAQEAEAALAKTGDLV